MKAITLNLALAASLASGAIAQPRHHHGHQAYHAKRDELRKREVVTTYVPATTTQYMLGDDKVSPEEAQAGIDKGLYVVVGESTPTFTPPAPKSTSTKEAGIFIEEVTSSSTSSTPTPTPTTSTSTSISTSTSTSISTSSSTSTTPKTSSAEPTTSSAAPATTTSSSSNSSGSGATGIDAEFPSGEIDCTEFPEEYGALRLDYLGYGGYSGLQYTPNFGSLLDSVISFIETGVSTPSGKTGFYSYACPAGYVKSQWPTAQGNTGQSIGGLYCNSKGKLELSNPKKKTLCEPGIEGITIVNKLSEGTSVCRTDYPGTENMVIPLDISGSGPFQLANINTADYYVWEGKSTTLQYYVNKKGVNAKAGCRWTCDEDADGCGNWAPVNIGVGQTDGLTYLSVFPNAAISTATLDFNIDVTGDISGECYYHVGEGFSGSSSGCTVSIPDGGSAEITFSSA
ncbi:glycoside hydrolase family 132 protein [Xylariaceae sp. FL1019]|nr:glycoside hydrolase family 132 protein [Xylariaceae sp. FL1019]